MVVLVVLVATVLNSDGAPADEAPVQPPGATLSTTAGGQDLEEHNGVWASVYYVLKTDPTPERDGIYRIPHGSECELFHRCDLPATHPPPRTDGRSLADKVSRA